MPSRLRLPLVVLLGVLVLAPSLGGGFYLDDYLHQAVLEGGDERVPMRPWGLFDFGTREDWRALDGKVGTFPWWTGEGWFVRFFRPLASLERWAGFALFGRGAAGIHALGLALFALLLVLVRRLYRVLGLDERTALFATLFVALSHTAVLPVAWIANRNSLLVALFAVGSLTLLLGTLTRARIAAGIALAACAALSKEDGIVALFLAACVLAVRARRESGASLRLGAGCALALAALHLGWLVLGGYGTKSVFYATPWADPLRYAANAAQLLAVAPVSFAGPFPLDVVMLLPPVRWPAILAAALIGLPLAVWIARTLPRTAAVGWLAAWTALFVAAQAGGMPSTRLFFVAEIGAAGLLALFLGERRRRAELGRTSRAGRAGTRVLHLSATLGSGLLALVMVSGMTVTWRLVRERVLATEVGSPELGHRELLVLQPPNQMLSFGLHNTWLVEQQDHDLTFRMLHGAPRPLRWTRTGEHSFELESRGTPFLDAPFESVYRTGRPFLPGERYESVGLSVTVLDAVDGFPTRLACEFERSLDDPRVAFLVAENGVLVRTPTPRVGETRELAMSRADGPWIP